MTPQPKLITFSEAAALLGLHSTKSIARYGKEGKLRLTGRGPGRKVVAASIDEYVEGRSAWHVAQGLASADAANQGQIEHTPPSQVRAKRGRRQQQMSTTEQIGPITSLSRRRPKQRRNSDEPANEPITTLRARKFGDRVKRS
jgi:hypothetical protein